MSATNVDVLEELGELIEDMTTTGRPELDETQLTKLKSICKSSNSHISHAYHLAMTQLKKEHAEIRLSSFQIIAELFSRSHAFRELLLGDFQVFLSLVVESDTKKPLPPPISTAKILKTKAVDEIENWFQKYGSHYKKLDLGYHYVKRLKHVKFDAIRNRTLVERRHEREREERKQRILQKKIDKVESEIAEHLGHIELCITEMNNCFKLLLPHPEDYEVHGVGVEMTDKTTKDKNGSQSKVNMSGSSNSNEKSNKTSMEFSSDNNSTNKRIDSGDNGDDYNDGDDDGDDNNEENDFDTVKDNLECGNDNEALKDHGLGSRNYEINIKINEMQPSVEETEDNSIVLETTRETHKEISYKYLPMINQWLTTFTKAGYSQERIQSVINLKQQLVSAKEKFFELNISPSKIKDSNATKDDDDDSNDDEMVDVPEKEGVEYILPENSADYGIDPMGGLNKINALLSNLKKSEEDDKEEFLKQYGFTFKDAQDPTSHARALLEARKKYGDKFVKKQSIDTVTAAASTNTANQVDPKRRKLLEEAPVVNFDMDLYHWDDPNYEPPKIIRSHNFNNYWANKDADPEHVFEESKGSMVKRKILFSGKFEPVKWSCRAPLPSGKLCPRKDRYKCPLHGVIVARDDHGRPTGESSSSNLASTSTSTSATTSSENTETWKDLQQDIEAATGIDLNPKGRKKRKARKSDDPNRKLSRKEKYARLTDINKSKKSPYSRLEKKVLSRDSLKRIAEDMDSLATKRVLEKFGDQFNYHFSK